MVRTLANDSSRRISQSGEEPLDCSRPAVALFWLLIGAGIAFGAMAAESGGRWTALLRVGSQNPLLPQIERELGPVPTPDAVGHDGQLYYLVARDPLGTALTPDVVASVFLDRPAYRYRRILLPLLAGGFGQFSATWTLWGLILGGVIGIALATLAVADLAFQLRVGGVAVMIAAANIGALLSAVLLTVDALALGLALGGLALTLRGRTRWAVAALAAAALTKETYVLVPVSLSAWVWMQGDRRRSALLAVLPLVPLACWSMWVSMAFPESAAGRENLSLPMAGYLWSAYYWFTQESDALEIVFGIVASVSLAAALGVLLRGGWLLRWLVAPWVVLAICSSAVVWGKPNNAARAFAILWPISVLGLAAGRGNTSQSPGQNGD